MLELRELVCCYGKVTAVKGVSLTVGRGQLVALIAVPLTWKSFLAGFILFRVFDIVKPPPVRQLERLPEGIGVVVDDVGAGLYALLIMHLLLHFRLLIG